MANYTEQQLDIIQNIYSSKTEGPVDIDAVNETVLNLISDLREAYHELQNFKQIEDLRKAHDERQSGEHKRLTHADCIWRHCPHPSQCEEYCSIRAGED